MMSKPLFKDFLFEKFLEWEKIQPGKRSSYSSYARYLSNNPFNRRISQQLISDWFSGKFVPGEGYALVLSSFYGNVIYEILDLKPPDPDFQRLTLIWHLIPEEAREKLAQMGEKYAAEKEPKPNAPQPANKTP